MTIVGSRNDKKNIPDVVSTESQSTLHTFWCFDDVRKKFFDIISKLLPSQSENCWLWKAKLHRFYRIYILSPYNGSILIEKDDDGEHRRFITSSDFFYLIDE